VHPRGQGVGLVQTAQQLGRIGGQVGQLGLLVGQKRPDALLLHVHRLRLVARDLQDAAVQLLGLADLLLERRKQNAQVLHREKDDACEVVLALG
jgi:hypothetical protein